ncbi:hypothetical protein AB431_18475 [Mycobacterium sp. EPa45]|nr:hypothetical protein AB431_18475 [Mycobacterium sp. EPa45]
MSLRTRHERGAQPIAYQLGDRGEAGGDLVLRARADAGSVQCTVHQPPKPEAGRETDKVLRPDVGKLEP